MSALRSLRQLSTSARTLSSSVARTSTSINARSALALARPSVLSASLEGRVVGAGAGAGVRAFSISARRMGEGASDIELAQKLQEEIKYEEEEGAGGAGAPEFLSEFQNQGVWSLEDLAGNDEVTLTRKFGNESVRLMFSIVDVDATPEYEPEEGAAEEEEAPVPAYPIRCSIAITKTSAPGCVNLDAVCQEGAFVVENVSYYADASIGVELTPEADWKRRGLYIGPQFDGLDGNLQVVFEKYLEERGINESLALFIPEYASYKEQKEYLQWLKSMKKFIEQ